jgi:dCMP deaminase
MKKRDDYINWDDYFMAISLLSAQRSKDPSTQVGACIVDVDKKIVSIGYNGFPIGIDDDKFPWGKEGEFHETKYPYVCHAEFNAIMNASTDLTDTSIYVTLFPCNECAKAIIQKKISQVYYIEDRGFISSYEIASKRMFDAVGIKYTKLAKPIITL